MYWWTFLVLVVYSPNSTVYEYIDNQLGKWFLTQCCNISSPAKLILVFIYALYLIYHSKLFPHPLPVHIHLWYPFRTDLYNYQPPYSLLLIHHKLIQSHPIQLHHTQYLHFICNESYGSEWKIYHKICVGSVSSVFSN